MHLKESSYLISLSNAITSGCRKKLIASIKSIVHTLQYWRGCGMGRNEYLTHPVFLGTI
jgi:hypothetical protein